MFCKTAILALCASLVAAQRDPVGDKPVGNSITRPLNEIVPACKPFPITWTPTTPNTVSLVLLRGPSENVKRLKTIVVGIPNSGTFSWTPDTGLEADTTHYGIQLIDDITGQYQYSTQFGISKGAECNGYSGPSSSSSAGGYPIKSTAAPSKASSTPGGYPVSTPVSSKANSTTIVTKTSAVVLSTGAPVQNSTVIQPTKPLTVPSSLIPSATGGSPTSGTGIPQSTGAASSLQAGLGLVGAVAAFAFML